MAMRPGTRFGPYEVADQIGAGGMGEVYRARDVNLKREVAIKVLPASFSSDSDRLARFQREAEVLASLNHPNIATIHGLEKSDGQTAIILELVEGPTLAERIAAGPIPPDEALNIAGQVADALEAAHSRQIVHRDLKPANIKLRHDGTVKVLDFGISKPIDPQAISGGSPMMTTPAVTQAGVILGTAAYMSPEQARGKFVDQRTDIWAFGCLLFEMLTGQPAFGGEDVMLTLARVLDRDTDLSSIPGTISPATRNTIRLCLEKDPNNRVADIRDVRLALQGRFDTDSAHSNQARTTKSGRWSLLLPVSLASMLLGGLIAVPIIRERGDSDAAQPVIRFELDNPVIPELGRSRPILAISPEGHQIAVSAQTGLYLRELDQNDAVILPGTESVGVQNFTPTLLPLFSPDGQWLAYFETARFRFRRIAINGGAPQDVVSVRQAPNGAAWGPDDTILYLQPDGIWRASLDGGDPELLIPTDAGEQFYGLQLLPGADKALTSVSHGTDRNDSEILVVFLKSGERKSLGVTGDNAAYVSTGHLVYGVGSDLYAAPFDIETFEFTGAPEPVIVGLAQPGGIAHYAVSSNGTLIYASQAALRRSVYRWYSRDGVPLDTVGQPYAGILGFQLSPDETRILDTRITGEQTFWITELNRNGIASPLNLSTDIPDSNLRDPIWSPDSQRIAFMDVTREQVFAMPATGGEASPLFQIDGLRGVENWSPDGRVISVDVIVNINAGMAMSVDGNGPPVSLARPAEGFDEPHFSPNGRFVAYNAGIGGEAVEVFVVPYPPTGERFQASSGGGSQPRWRGDGKELFYLSPSGTMMAVDVETDSEFSAATPRPLFETGLRVTTNNDQYAVTKDGQRFLILTSIDNDGEDSAPAINVVVNWFEELQEFVPTD